MTKKQWLKSLAEKIAADIDGELGEAHSFVKIPSPAKLFRTETAGYSVAVARFRLNRKHCALELWLDEWAHALRLYYGLSTTDRLLIDIVADSTAAWRRPAAKLSGKDVEENGGHWHLIEPLPQQKLNRPIAEIYWNWSFYGCYSSVLMTPLIMNGRLQRKLMHEVVSFLDKIVKTLAGIRSEHYGTLTATERKRIVQHEQEEQWARDRGLARKCKLRDGYSCQICGFCPSKMYKRINASGAVEAHHKSPFSVLSLHRKHVNTKLEDLITVCRNCHAALHAPSVGGNVSSVCRAFTGQWPKGRLN